MTDLSLTIAPKSDQLNADDMIGGKTMTITVTKVSLCKEPDQPIAIGFDGDNGKPYKPGKSMRRVLVNIWGPDGSKYVGRRMTLFRDEKIQFGGTAVGGIRISHMSDIDEPVTMALTMTKASRKPFTVRPLAAVTEPVAKPTMTAEDWANAQMKLLPAMETEDEFYSWVQKTGLAMTKLKSNDESTWAILNELVAATRKRIVGDFE
jgi:hypothetical protein